METLKHADVALWKYKIRCCRMKTASCQPGVTNLDDRRGAVACAVTTMRQISGVSDECVTLWLTKKRFHSHHTVFEGDSAEEAKNKWTAALANPDVQRMGLGRRPRVSRERHPAHSRVPPP